MENKIAPDPPPTYEEASTSAVTSQPTAVPVMMTIMGPPVVQELGLGSKRLMCPSCNILVATRIEYKASTKTHICAAACCILLLWPCVCCAYCLQIYGIVEHYCPNCNYFVGSYQSELCHKVE